MSRTTGHDMSHYWRLVSNENGLITGTWWVTRPDDQGRQHVKPIDVVLWSEGRHHGLTLGSDDLTAFITDGEVEPIRARARHDHVTREANARADELADVVRVVAAAANWPTEETR